jgi:pyruvate/2-oxoglutarate dehydrogenase complex dihydrolipoamide acyltransferase (E2) component
VGTTVKADDIIARIETDKVTVDILAQFNGTITKYHCEEGDTVPVGAPFVDIDPDATGSAAPQQSNTPKAPEVQVCPLYLIIIIRPNLAHKKLLKLQAHPVRLTYFLTISELQEVPSMGDSISEGVVQEFVVSMCQTSVDL